MTATDLRGGAAMVIGALCARGESELAGTAHLKRGYAELVPTLPPAARTLQNADKTHGGVDTMEHEKKRAAAQAAGAKFPRSTGCAAAP